MKHSARIGTKLATILSLLAAGVSITATAHAERIRHCTYSFTAIVETEDLFANVVRDEVLLISGEAAGRHGGVQANTARERARDRIVSCIGDWNSMDDHLASSQISECTNTNISSVPGFDDETVGRSLKEAVAELLPNLCSDLTCSEEVLVRISEASLLVSGDNRCPASREYPLEEMLVGEFCEGL